jgi:hypothetical protein
MQPVAEAAPVHAPASRNTVRILIIGAVVIAAFVVIWLVRNRPAVPLSFKEQQLTHNSNDNPITSVAVSPDGRELVYHHPPGVEEVALVAATEEAVTMEKARKGAGRVRSTRKTKDVDLVAVVVDIHQIVVGVEYVGFESSTESYAFDHRPIARDAPENGGVNHSADAGMVVGYLIPSDLEGCKA